jgi:hypothetical protein
MLQTTEWNFIDSFLSGTYTNKWRAKSISQFNLPLGSDLEVRTINNLSFFNFFFALKHFFFTTTTLQ